MTTTTFKSGVKPTRNGMRLKSIDYFRKYKWAFIGINRCGMYSFNSWLRTHGVDVLFCEGAISANPKKWLLSENISRKLLVVIRRHRKDYLKACKRNRTPLSDRHLDKWMKYNPEIVILDDYMNIRGFPNV